MNLRNFADSYIYNKNEEINIRNRSILYEYFGCGTLLNPTYESIALQYNCSRQYIEQIISGLFKRQIKERDRESFKRIIDAASEKKVVYYSEFKSFFKAGNLIEDDFNLGGLLNIIKLLNINFPYTIINSELKKSKADTLENESDFLLVRNDFYETFKNRLKPILTKPGQVGIVSLSEIYQDYSELDYKLIEMIIKCHPQAWFYKDKNNFYYTFENRDNIIANTISKINGVTNNCDIEILSEIIEGVINRRSHKEITHPDSKLISRYLADSRYSKANGNTVSLIDANQTRQYSKADATIMSYFEKRENKSCDYTELKEEIISSGLSEDSAKKECYSSPFLWVDKSAGRKNYKFSFITNYSTKTEEIDRYLLYRTKLLRLSEETDGDSQGKYRLEQTLLREYLFKDRETLKCAICGREYSTKSLVTAHKKKRSLCSARERIDPYIVMPLCKFGCDYLYEERFIEIKDGKVHRNKLRQAELKTENDFISEIENNRIDEIWLMGNESYFY